MLLGAAKLLKQHEQELQGTVKLFFQPAEEGGAGGDLMVKEGTASSLATAPQAAPLLCSMGRSRIATCTHYLSHFAGSSLALKHATSAQSSGLTRLLRLGRQPAMSCITLPAQEFASSVLIGSCC